METVTLHDYYPITIEDLLVGVIQSHLVLEGSGKNGFFQLVVDPCWMTLKQPPELTITISTSTMIVPSPLYAGYEIKWEYLITNIGGYPLTRAQIEDTLGHHIIIDDIGIDQTRTITVTHRVTESEIMNNHLEVMAHVTANFLEHSNGPCPCQIKSLPSFIWIPLPQWTQVICDSYRSHWYKYAEKIQYELMITNQSNYTMTNLRAVDSYGYSYMLDSLTPQDSRLLIWEYRLTDQDYRSSSVVNHVTLTSDQLSPTFFLNRETLTVLPKSPSVKISVNGLIAPCAVVHVGTPIIYVFTVTNDGGYPLDHITLQDTRNHTVWFHDLLPDQSEKILQVSTVQMQDIIYQLIENHVNLTAHMGSLCLTSSCATHQLDVPLWTQLTIGSFSASLSDYHLSPGTTLCYTTEIINQSNYPLAHVSFRDSYGYVCHLLETLEPLEKHHVQWLHCVTENEKFHQSIRNTVTIMTDTANVSEDLVTCLYSPPSIRVIPVTPIPDDAGGESSCEIVYPGSHMRYTYHVINTGGYPLSEITLQDSLGHLLNRDRLETEEWWTVTVMYPVQLSDILNRNITNSVTTVAYVDHDHPPVKSDPVEITSAISQWTRLLIKHEQADLEIPVTVGSRINYQCSVINQSNHPLDHVTLLDSNGIVRTWDSMPPLFSQQVKWHRLVTAEYVMYGHVENSVILKHSGPGVTVASCQIHVLLPDPPKLVLDQYQGLPKHPDCLVGSPIMYTYHVCNRGQYPLDNVILTDHNGQMSRHMDRLEPGEDQFITWNEPITNDDLKCGNRSSQATLTAQMATIPITMRQSLCVATLAISRTKVHYQQSLSLGQFQIELTNTGNRTLLNVRLSLELLSIDELVSELTPRMSIRLVGKRTGLCVLPSLVRLDLSGQDTENHIIRQTEMLQL